MNGFAFRLISGELGIGSCTIDEIPDSCKEQFEKAGKDVQRIVAYYFKERDCIVMNEEYAFFEGYKEIALAYMGISEAYRNNALKCAEDDSIYRFLIFLESVIRYREEMKKGEKEHEAN